MSSSTDLAHPELKGKEAWIVDPAWDPVAKQILQYGSDLEPNYPVVRELLTGLNIIEGDITRVESRNPEVFLESSKNSPKRICDSLFVISYTDKHHSTIETAIHIEIQRANEAKWNQRILIYRGFIKGSWRWSLIELNFLAPDGNAKSSRYKGPVERELLSNKIVNANVDPKFEDQTYNINLKEISKYIENNTKIEFLGKEIGSIGKLWLRLFASKYVFKTTSVDEKTNKELDEPLYKYLYDGGETTTMKGVLSMIGKDNMKAFEDNYIRTIREFIKKDVFINSIKELMEKYKMSAREAVFSELSKLNVSYDNIIDILKDDYISQFISSKRAPPVYEKINSTE